MELRIRILSSSLSSAEKAILILENKCSYLVLTNQQPQVVLELLDFEYFRLEMPEEIIEVHAVLTQSGRLPLP